MRSLVRTIKNIFQDSVIRIPYYGSTIKPTNTIAIFQQNQDIIKDFTHQIIEIIKNQRGLLGYQCKLYYEKQLVKKTVIVQFYTVQQAKQFYVNYAQNFDKSIFQNLQIHPQNKDKSNNKKYLLYFCKDITNSGVNMEQILYSLGKVCIQMPQSTQIDNIIKQVAKFVVVEGVRGQQQINYCKQLSINAPQKYFLDFMDPKFLSSQASYYRWKVYSYIQGDGDRNYRIQPFQMTIGGPIYYPPEQQSDKYSYKILNNLERQYFTKIIETISTRKFHIQEAMSFCIMNIGSAIEICSIIAIVFVEKCNEVSTTQSSAKNAKSSNVKQIIAIFYLISDIIFNSSSTVYRDIFTVLLPLICQSLYQIKQATIKISQAVQNWSKKFMFEDEFIKGLLMLIKGQLPSLRPNGMQQMTRVEHQSYKNLLKIETPQQIQQLCWKYGLPFSVQKIAESLRNLATIITIDSKDNGNQNQVQPLAGQFDGEPLDEKDILKIKNKTCKVVSCQNIPIKYLLQKDKHSKSVSIEKE